MTKAELDAEYDQRLQEIQSTCDHVCDDVVPGEYGCDCYTVCPVCEDEVNFHRHLNKRHETLKWNNECVQLREFNPPLSVSKIRCLYGESCRYVDRYLFSVWLRGLLKDQPMSKWKKILQRTISKRKYKHD